MILKLHLVRKIGGINMQTNYLKDILKETVKLNVLYVEDNEETRVHTLKMLQNFFSSISIGIDGNEGLSIFKNGDFDIIFTDIDMPYMNGLEMIKKIRITDVDIPIIILSSYDDTEYFLESIKLGIDGYILKPFNYEEMENIIVNLLNKVSNMQNKNNVINLSNGFQWDIVEEKLIKEGLNISLTKNEFALVRLLCSNHNRIYSSDYIETMVFDDDTSDNARIRNLLSRFKKKLQYELIESIYGEGYRLKYD